MSGLETLPPDQRAVLQLILVQGRGYADLATLLRLDVEAVRSRAHAGLDALGGAAGVSTLDATQRARVADYLLGQQDDGERIVTFAELGDTPDACRWAQELRERLTAIAGDELPAVPAAASSNGHAPSPTPVPAPVPAAVVVPAAAQPAAEPTSPPPAAEPAQPSTAEPTPPPTTEPAPPAATAEPTAPPTPPPSQPERPAAPDAPRSSRLGGAVLLAGIAALAIVLAIVLIGGDDDPSPRSAAQTPTQPSARTQPSTTPAAQPRLIAQVNLNATAAGGEAIGIGLVQRSGRREAIAIEAQRLPANGANDIYAVWLQGSRGSRFLGFVPRQVRANGRFTVSAALPGNARAFSTVLITREGITEVPQTPGEAILTGALRLR